MQKISLFVILSVLLTMPMAFGQEEALGAQKITLTADNTAYQEGDVITITGTIEKVLPGMPVTLQIFFEKNLIQVSQVKVSQDGEFTDTFTAAGPQWKNEGKVTIKADYGGASTELNIEFFKNTSGEYTSNYEVKIPDGGDNGTGSIHYQSFWTFIDGGEIFIETRDWADDSRFSDNVSINIDSKELNEWLRKVWD